MYVCVRGGKYGAAAASTGPPLTLVFLFRKLSSRARQSKSFLKVDSQTHEEEGGGDTASQSDQAEIPSHSAPQKRAITAGGEGEIIYFSYEEFRRRGRGRRRQKMRLSTISVSSRELMKASPKTA